MVRALAPSPKKSDKCEFVDVLALVSVSCLGVGEAGDGKARLHTMPPSLPSVSTGF